MDRVKMVSMLFKPWFTERGLRYKLNSEKRLEVIKVYIGKYESINFIKYYICSYLRAIIKKISLINPQQNYQM